MKQVNLHAAVSLSVLHAFWELQGVIHKILQNICKSYCSLCVVCYRKTLHHATVWCYGGIFEKSDTQTISQHICLIFFNSTRDVLQTIPVSTSSVSRPSCFKNKKHVENTRKYTALCNGILRQYVSPLIRSIEKYVLHEEL